MDAFVISVPPTVVLSKVKELLQDYPRGGNFGGGDEEKGYVVEEIKNCLKSDFGNASVDPLGEEIKAQVLGYLTEEETEGAAALGSPAAHAAHAAHAADDDTEKKRQREKKGVNEPEKKQRRDEAPAADTPASLVNCLKAEGVKLSEKRFLKVRPYKGKTFVDIREYYEDNDNNLKPGKKGISLAVAQWEFFSKNLQEVDAAFQSCSKEYKLLLPESQKRVTVSNFKGRTLLDIREWYEKDGEFKPGRKGISLTSDQWTAIKSSANGVSAAL